MSEPRRRGSEATRQRVLAATIELLAERGTTGTGLNHVAERSGVSYGSVYNQFREGKDALIAAAIEEAGADVAGALKGVFQQTDSLSSAANIMFAYGAALLESSEFARGCPVGTAASDGHSVADVGEAARTVFDSWRGLIADSALAFGASPSDAQRFASSALSLYEGALLIGRVNRSTDALEHAAAVAADLATQITS